MTRRARRTHSPSFKAKVAHAIVAVLLPIFFARTRPQLFSALGRHFPVRGVLAGLVQQTPHHGIHRCVS